MRKQTKNKKKSRSKPPVVLAITPIVLALIPLSIALWVWLSALAFVPVPWPDDSAFYFVAKELFQWPPRWVMLPQAPFEPTYRIFNFNTMPLYPILLGLGRFIGIDGSFLLKFWPLSAWGLTGSLLAVVLYKQRLPFLLSALVAFCFALDPELRWASVLVRPESLIGLFGMAIVLGLTFGFPERFQPRKLWDPIACLLALGAYAHFNAVHLLFPVILTLALQPKRIIQIGLKTTLYLIPWLVLVLMHFQLFIQQMMTQWKRLTVPNPWLTSVKEAIQGMFQALGSPEPWPEFLFWPALLIWFIILIGIITGLILPALKFVYQKMEKAKLEDIPAPKSNSSPKRSAFPNGHSTLQDKLSSGSGSGSGSGSSSSSSSSSSSGSNSNSNSNLHPDRIDLRPSVGWILGAIWLYHSKFEVWFMYYVHIAVWCFAGIFTLEVWRLRNTLLPYLRPLTIGVWVALLTGITLTFGYVDITQADRMGATQTWNWPTYYDFVNCIDYQLSHLESELGVGKPFHVWNPTWPDVIIELSRKHPHWEMTRTNDFHERNHLAIQHGWDTEAVVVTESINWPERNISARPEEVPGLNSAWMSWKDYFLYQLWTAPGWKPNRFICQRGRFQAFIYMIEVPAKK